MADEGSTSLHRAIAILTALGSREGGTAEHGIGVVQIARLVGWEKSQVSRTLKTLAEAGLVARMRGAADRRQVRVIATPHARDMLAQLADAHRAELRRLKPTLGELIASL